MFVLLLLSQGCETVGQQNYDESDWLSSREGPTYVKEKLPSIPDTLLTLDQLQFYQLGSVDSIAATETINKIRQYFKQIVAFSGQSLPKKGILKYFFYADPETKGLTTQNSSPCHIDFDKKEVHLIVSNIFNDFYLGQSNELILQAVLGEQPIECLQKGLAIYLSENWQRFGFRFWAKKLLIAEQLPALSDLIDESKWEYSSDLIYGSAAASLVDFLIKKHEATYFIKKYKAGLFSSNELADLEKEWKEHCSSYSPETINKTASLPYLKGFNFAHEGYRIYNGYGSRKAAQALQHLSNLQANAIAIVPYSFARYPKKPHPIPVAKRAGSENDESVIQSSEQAQALGMTVVLKPQIWVGRGMWTGDIEMSGDVDWILFFKQYGHWIAHYAILAEIYDWESLCIGTELVATTLNRENDWKLLAQNLRHLYTGQLTYAANWGDEFEKLSLWEELDYIGLNCYYPLSKKDDPTDRELKKGFDEVIQKIETVYKKYKKPIVFTEIGFPCIEAPWKEPHNDYGDFTPNANHQQRCYEVVFEKIKNQPWCNGILWWKYPSDLEHNPRRKTGFTPHNKLAEGVVARWFKQLGNSK